MKRNKEYSSYSCYICGKPKEGLLNKDPCNKCIALAEKGIVLISVRDGESGETPNRTGEMIVIKEKAFERIFGKPTSRFYFIEDSVLRRLKGE
jgi:hypothetical protein